MFYGRGLRQLFIAWGVALVVMLGLYRVEVVIPALHDMIFPRDWIIAGVTAFITLRWLRARSPKDRRSQDRRHRSRRDEPSADADK
jgi:hypothetical protein